MNKTECAICTKELEWKLELFTQGKLGEPVCDECNSEEEEGEQ